MIFVRPAVGAPEPRGTACYSPGMAIARALVVVAVVCLAPLPADARPNKAWTAAQARLPASTTVLIGVDLTQLGRSMLFKSALPMVLRKAGDVADAYALVKDTCGLDPFASIRAVVVGTDADKEQGAIFIAVHGLDEPRLVTCVEAIARDKGAKDPEVTVTRDGAITEVSLATGKIYWSWIGKDVLVVPMKLDDKAQLQRWTRGKRALAKAPVAAYLGKVKMASAIWAIAAVPQEVDGTKMKAGYGWLALARGALAPDLHLVLGSAADARATADRTNRELATIASGPQLADSLKAMLQKLSVAAVGSEVVVKATVPEADVISLGAALLRGL